MKYDSVLQELVTMVQQTHQETVHPPPSRVDQKTQKKFTDNTLYEPLEKDSKHMATMVETPASLHCGLTSGAQYCIVISPECIYLLNQQGLALMNLKWPYKYIRRYGRSRTTFTLEAGRKCPSGDGLFTFKVGDGEKVFKEVQERTSAMKSRTAQAGLINPSHHASPSASPPDTPSSPHSPEAQQPPLPDRRYGSHPFDSDTMLPNAGSSNNNPTSPTTTNNKEPKKKHHFFEKLTKNFRGSTEDLAAKITNKRTSNGSTSGFDDLDGHVSDAGTAGSYHRGSPLSTPSPNAVKRQLPEIPRGQGGGPRTNPPPKPTLVQLPLAAVDSEHIYEDADKVVQHSRTTAPELPHHYHVYDATGSSRRRSPEVWEDGERCDSGPGLLLNQQVPLRQESCDGGQYEEHYSSIPEVKYSSDGTDVPDYAEPQTMLPAQSKVSGILNTLHSNAQPPVDDTEMYAVAGNEYGCLDLINAQNRPHSDIVGKPTPGLQQQEAIYGRLSTGQVGKKSEYGQGLYANTGRLK